MAPTFLQVASGLFAVFASLSAVRAETHTVSFDNKCGFGTPTLILGGKIVSTGAPFTTNGVVNGIAYLQNGDCLFNGENCPLLEMNLANPQCPGCGSSTDISLIPPHAFTVPVSFSYYNGCDSQGATCNHANCNTAFFKPDDNQVQVQCEANNVNLLITFCGDATNAPAPAPAPQTSSAKPAPPKATSSKAAPPPPPKTSSIAPAHSSPVAPPPPPASSSAAPATIVNVGAAPSIASASASSAASSASASARPGRCSKSKKRSLLEKKAAEAEGVLRRSGVHRRAH